MFQRSAALLRQRAVSLHHSFATEGAGRQLYTSSAFAPLELLCCSVYCTCTASRALLYRNLPGNSAQTLGLGCSFDLGSYLQLGISLIAVQAYRLASSFFVRVDAEVTIGVAM